MTTPEALSHETRQIEGLPGLEELRGPNSALKLVNLMENFVRDVATTSRFETAMLTNREFNFHIVTPIRNLQEWAKSINQEIVKTADSIQPTNRASLEQMVSEMVHDGTISDRLNLRHVEFAQPEILFVARPEQWHLVKALFEIDTSGLTTRNSMWWKGPYLHVPLSHPYLKSIYPRMNSGVAPWPDSASITDVHDIMFQLLDDAVKQRGHRLDDITKPQDKFLGDEQVHSAPTVIDGVSAIISTNGYGVADKGEHSANGCPNIHALILRFDPSFLASVRPLTEEEYLKYIPKEEQERRERMKQEYEQKKSNNKQAEEPSSGSGQGQKTENFRVRRETFDPRDPKRYYKTLGVNPDADPEDLDEVILVAYRRLAQKYHADTGGDTASHERMVEVNLAYEFLSKGDNRKNYGRHN